MRTWRLYVSYFLDVYTVGACRKDVPGSKGSLLACLVLRHCCCYLWFCCPDVAILHGGMQQGDRLAVMRRMQHHFLGDSDSSRTPLVLVATDVAARGLDFPPALSLVVCYDAPHDPEVYVHRVGRAGRAGRSGLAWSLLTKQEKRQAAFVVEKMETSGQTVPRSLLEFAMQFRKHFYSLYMTPFNGGCHTAGHSGYPVCGSTNKRGRWDSKEQSSSSNNSANDESGTASGGSEGRRGALNFAKREQRRQQWLSTLEARRDQRQQLEQQQRNRHRRDRSPSPRRSFRERPQQTPPVGQEERQRSQLGVSGSPEFLGCWDPSRCLPLLPYTTPTEGGMEPSLWFADVEVDEQRLGACRASATAGSECNSAQRDSPKSPRDSFSDRLIAAVARKYSPLAGSMCSGSLPDMRRTTNDETSSVTAAATCRIDHRSPEIIAILDSHPLKSVQFEFKFILWTPESPVAPYVPNTPGEPFQCVAYGSPFCTWRTWLFPPPPAQRAVPPSKAMHVVWEGSGPSSNRKFCFDPMDVVVDECESGNLEVLYLCKIARFEDPRADSANEYGHTTRFYNTVKAEGRMDYSRILPNLYVGSCPRQLKHIRQLKQDLKVTAVFNLQTTEDIKNNFPDPIASTRTPEAVGQLYESAGMRYVWMPTEDMSDACRKLAVAQCALVLDALIRNGHTVYVHCNAGVGRSVAAVSAYLCFCVGIDQRKVNFLVSTRRPVAYWDEKAIKAGLLDYQAKFGKAG
ncbi:LOW QUALITY PROTEIN: ATP-dependent RNA helicase, putative [Eimeria mitis]|uniref:ATP-dependent RNA helicase, putative n=1 Tax=Eimeria mitis TaxID=44415 RepID=U6KDK1_9EIME|nr:LOW QUALITY PROTEIN: ATP-dependent RNA helicase, putative [Eimeria mitis]CDJ36110.1 ATP-dependent RNA helicase, putative [Eimeria mitis]